MTYLTVEEIIALHEKLIKTTGGSEGLRDRSLLESAVYSAFAAFDGIEKYASLEEKSARYAFSLTQNHAFVDGNKRIGILVMLMTLELNHVKLKFTQQELIRLGLNLADGSFSYDDTLRWIKEHKV